VSVVVRAEEAKPGKVSHGKGGEEGGKAWTKSVYGRVGSSGNYNLLANAIEKVGLADQLEGAGPFTLFAPDDDAFGDACRALGTTKMNLLTLESLPGIVKNHVVQGKVTSADLKEGLEATTIGGETVKFAKKGANWTINGVKVKKADVTATNGVIHVITGVIGA
jgi:uncharacterized surface protein with fasciclin (FAS1) repeats